LNKAQPFKVSFGAIHARNCSCEIAILMKELSDKVYKIEKIKNKISNMQLNPNFTMVGVTTYKRIFGL